MITLERPVTMRPRLRRQLQGHVPGMYNSRMRCLTLSNFRLCTVSADHSRDRNETGHSLSSVSVVAREVVWVGVPPRWRILKAARSILLFDLPIIVRDLHLIDNLPPRANRSAPRGPTSRITVTKTTLTESTSKNGLVESVSALTIDTVCDLVPSRPRAENRTCWNT